MAHIPHSGLQAYTNSPGLTAYHARVVLDHAHVHAMPCLAMQTVAVASACLQTSALVCKHIPCSMTAFQMTAVQNRHEFKWADRLACAYAHVHLMPCLAMQAVVSQSVLLCRPYLYDRGIVVSVVVVVPWDSRATFPLPSLSSQLPHESFRCLMVAGFPSDNPAVDQCGFCWIWHRCKHFSVLVHCYSLFIPSFVRSTFPFLCAEHARPS